MTCSLPGSRNVTQSGHHLTLWFRNKIRETESSRGIAINWVMKLGHLIFRNFEWKARGGRCVCACASTCVPIFVFFQMTSASRLAPSLQASGLSIFTFGFGCHHQKWLPTSRFPHSHSHFKKCQVNQEIRLLRAWDYPAINHRRSRTWWALLIVGKEWLHALSPVLYLPKLWKL